MGTVEEMQESIKAAKLQVSMAETVDRLSENKDFKRVIIDYYLNSYAAELVRTKAAPYMQDEKNQRYVDNQLGAIGHLDSFLNLVLEQGRVALSTIENTEHEIIAAMQEGDDE